MQQLIEVDLFHGDIQDRLLRAWSSLEWWKIIPSGQSLRAQDIRDFQSRLDLRPPHSTKFPRPSPDIGYRLVASQGNLSLCDFISTSIYLLSNNLHDPRDGDKGLHLLCLLFEHDVLLFAHLFTQILQCQPSTGRAAWQSLFKHSERYHHKVIFKYLLNTGMRYEWLDPSDAGVLVSALEMDFPPDIVLDILDYVCRPGHNHWWRHILDVILAAHERGQFGIAHLLLRRFDINAELPCLKQSEVFSVFLAFILDFDSKNEGHWNALDFLVSNGADVDRLLPSWWYTTNNQHGRRDWYDENEINRALRPTILDQCYFVNPSLFHKLVRQSKLPLSTLTKTGLLISLEKGPAALQEYLESRVPALNPSDWKTLQSPLEFILVDQLRPQWWSFAVHRRDGSVNAKYLFHDTNLKVVRNLIQYGDDLGQHSAFLPHMHELLNRVLQQLRRGATDDGLQLLETLVRKGVAITETHLKGAVELRGTKLLSLLRPKVRGFPDKSAAALAEAAAMDNFEAVEFLLQSGVDPNALIDAERADRVMQRLFVVRGLFACLSPEQAFSVLAVAAVAHDGDRCCSVGMTRYLAERGAKLVVGPNDSTTFAFTAYLLANSWSDTELFDKIKFVLATLKQSKNWTNPPAYLPELCVGYEGMCQMQSDDRKQRLRVFEYLLDEGAELSPGSPLAALVHIGSPRGLVERVLHLGAEVDAYTAVSYRHRTRIRTPLQAAASRGNEDGVKMFLKQGANVNSPPRGANGKTALQDICSWSPATEEEHRRKMRICNLLMQSGADVNAPAARMYGMTALQAAVILGDLELAAILIRNGAHVNAPPAEIGLRHGYHYCALDSAAFHGRLDIAKLLLNANALSRHPGKTGYDGAIELAVSQGHHAVASLIREHPRNFTESNVDSIPVDIYRINGYGTDNDYWIKGDEESVEDSVHSANQESSRLGAAGNGSASESLANVLAGCDSNTSKGAHESPGFQAVGTALVDDFTSNFGTAVDFRTEDDMQMPAASMGSFAETLEAQALQDVADGSTDERTSHFKLGTGFVLPEDDMQLPEVEWMLQNPSEAWAGVPDDSALWQQVFDMQDEEDGFAKFDQGRQLPWLDPLSAPCIDGEDVADRDFTR